MEQEVKTETELVVELGIRDQLFKFLICSAVGFLATKTAENVFDSVVKRRLAKPITIRN